MVVVPVEYAEERLDKEVSVLEPGPRLQAVQPVEILVSEGHVNPPRPVRIDGPHRVKLPVGGAADQFRPGFTFDYLAGVESQHPGDEVPATRFLPEPDGGIRMGDGWNQGPAEFPGQDAGGSGIISEDADRLQVPESDEELPDQGVAAGDVCFQPVEKDAG